MAGGCRTPPPYEDAPSAHRAGSALDRRDATAPARQRYRRADDRRPAAGRLALGPLTDCTDGDPEARPGCARPGAPPGFAEQLALPARGGVRARLSGGEDLRLARLGEAAQGCRRGAPSE